MLFCFEFKELFTLLYADELEDEYVPNVVSRI